MSTSLASPFSAPNALIETCLSPTFWRSNRFLKLSVMYERCEQLSNIILANTLSLANFPNTDAFAVCKRTNCLLTLTMLLDVSSFFVSLHEKVTSVSSDESLSSLLAMHAVPSSSSSAFSSFSSFLSSDF